MKTIHTTTLIVMVMSIITGCTKDNYHPGIDPSNAAGETSNTLEKVWIKQFIKPENFVADVTNPYFPLTLGDTFYYETIVVEEGDTIFEDSYVAVTSDIKMIQGIACMVIHDVVITEGKITEDTYDWHVQDIYGNVWYFGEDTKSLQEDGSWSTEGSWESGVDGAIAGLIMPGDPDKHLGETYRQEKYVGYAQDNATVISTDETVVIDYGTFTNCVLTEETTPLDPGVIGYKWYAPGIGQVKSSTTIGGDEHQELVGKN